MIDIKLNKFLSKMVFENNMVEKILHYFSHEALTNMPSQVSTRGNLEKIWNDTLKSIIHCRRLQPTDKKEIGRGFSQNNI